MSSHRPRHPAVVLAAAPVLLFAAAASAQLAPGTNINTGVRTLVTLQESGAPGTVVGLFDTGDPRQTFSRETGALLSIPPVTPIEETKNPPAFPNQGTTTPRNVTATSVFGAMLDGPQLNVPAVVAPNPAFIDKQVQVGDPAHGFTAANVVAAPGVTVNGIYNYYRDFPAGSGDYSENHAGTAFVASADPRNNLVAFVDPTNASPIPFDYDRTKAGNGRGLQQSGAGDNLTASVNFMSNANSQVPDRTRNADPGFVTFVDLIPVWTNNGSTMTPLPADATPNNALPVDRRITYKVDGTAPAVGVSDAAKVDHLVPVNYKGLSPGYAPADAAGNVLLFTGYTFEVKNNGPAGALNVGGVVSADGFVRRDGTVQVQIVNDVTNAVISTTNVQLPSEAPRPFGRIVVPFEDPALSIDTGPADKLIDTGGVATGVGGSAVIGAPTLNRFGQYWDFSPKGGAANPNNGTLTLIAPTGNEARAAVASGALITVDRNTVGLTGTGVNYEKSFGSVPQIANAAGGLSTPSDGVANQAAGTVFKTNFTGSNASYIDEAATKITRGAAGQVIDAVATGRDGIASNGDLYFSVGLNGFGGVPFLGAPPSAVRTQTTLGQVASDVFKSPAGRVKESGTISPGPNPTSRQRIPGGNSLFVNQEIMGLGQNAGPAYDASSLPSSDNLLDFDLYTDKALPASSFSNLDGPIVKSADAGTAARPRVGGDRMAATFDLYFSTRGSAAIFRDDVNTTFASAGDMGLLVTDDIDALALYRPSVSAGVTGGALAKGAVNAAMSADFTGFGQGRFDPDTFLTMDGIDIFHGGSSDVAIFSLAPGSADLTTFGLSAADLFITDFDGTFTLYATAESLGLAFGADVDGLDSVPEPASFAVVAVVSITLTARRRRRDHQ